MNLAFLKKIRIIVSLVFTIFILFVFLDVSYSFQVYLARIVPYVQFVPSLLSFITLISATGAGFIFILLLTFFFGRIYCSFMCPLGTLQDIFIWLNRKFRKLFHKKRNVFQFRNAHNKLRFSILAVTSITFIFGIVFFVNILDPYSLFGKLTTTMFRHNVITFNNLLASILEKFSIFSVYPIDHKPFNAPLLIFLNLSFLLIAYYSVKRGRIYCNTICPVGSLLAIVSKYSIFKISFNDEKCSECGLCRKVCKAECLDNENRIIDETRCVSCFNCFDSCPDVSFTYKLNYSKKAKSLDAGKRTFLLRTGVAATAVSLSSCKKVTGHDDNKYYKKPKPATPPGSIDLYSYKHKCTACQLCVAACPTQVLQPSIVEFGLTGLFQPVMDYPNSFCNYDCTACMDVCPTDAIIPMNREEKKLTQIGVAKLIEEICVVFVNKKDCGACSEQCPTKAVNMVPYENNLSKPVMNPDICVGCGACEHACPTKPFRAIYVEANIYHKKAKKPVIKKIEEKKTDTEDFPF